MDFSVLMSVYYKENPEFLKRAFESIWDLQTLKPSQIVLVEDGPLSDGLYAEIKRQKELLKDKLTVVSLEKNVGLGVALAEGLKACKYDIVARMDGDDVADQDRFLTQIDFLKTNPDISIVGSYISEFEGGEENIYAYRTPPVSHADIYSFAKKRNPLNHMTVMFKKEAIASVGGYMPFMGFEDYYLWVRMLKKGFLFANLPRYLVNARAGLAMVGRRGGLKYAISEYRLQKEFLRLGFINFGEFLFNASIRFLSRIVPEQIRIALYQKALRR